MVRMIVFSIDYLLGGSMEQEPIDVEAEFVKLLEQAENNPIKPLSEEFFARIEALKVKAGQ